MINHGTDESPLLNVADAAAHLGVTEAFVRRLVLERRVRYYKVGKFVRFRTADLDAFVEAGRHDPVDILVHLSSSRAGSDQDRRPHQRGTHGASATTRLR